MNSITLENCGPVARLTIPVQPGATILRGASDIGKSETIKAVSRLAGGREDVTCKAGEAKGFVEGFGVRLGLGRTTRRTGELTALAIEDGFGLGTLIDGDNLATAEAADRARIKALLRISGAKAELSRFHALLPGGKAAFERYVPTKAVETDDPVEMAGRIKRELESAARKLESEADTEEGKATAKRNAGDGLDLTAETDAAKLQQAHSQSVAYHARLQQQRDAAEEAQASADEARQKLATATGGNRTVAECQADEAEKKAAHDAFREPMSQLSGEIAGLQAAAMPLIKAQAEWDAFSEEFNAADVALQEAKRQLRLAEQRCAAIESKHQAARDRISEAKRQARTIGEKEQQLSELQTKSDAALGVYQRAHDATAAARRTAEATAGWQAAIDQTAGVNGPQPAEVLEALDAVTKARKAIEQAAVIRAAKEQVDQAAKHLERAKELRMEARSVRDAGKETDAVLSAMVASPNLTVSQGRLMTFVEGRGHVFYHDRSDGTRTKIACMEKLARVRALNADQLAIIPVGQRQWNDLAPAAKKELIGWAVENRACILTAEVSDSPVLTAESVTE